MKFELLEFKLIIIYEYGYYFTYTQRFKFSRNLLIRYLLDVINIWLVEQFLTYLTIYLCYWENRKRKSSSFFSSGILHKIRVFSIEKWKTEKKKKKRNTIFWSEIVPNMPSHNRIWKSHSMEDQVVGTYRLKTYLIIQNWLWNRYVFV